MYRIFAYADAGCGGCDDVRIYVQHSFAGNLQNSHIPPNIIIINIREPCDLIAKVAQCVE